MKPARKRERAKAMLAAIDVERDRVCAWDRLNEQRALTRGAEIAFLKSLGWKPVDYPDLNVNGQELIDAGEPVRWHRGVAGEEFDQDEAVALAERWWIEEQNARGWKPGAQVAP